MPAPLSFGTVEMLKAVDKIFFWGGGLVLRMRAMFYACVLIGNRKGVKRADFPNAGWFSG